VEQVLELRATLVGSGAMGDRSADGASAEATLVSAARSGSGRAFEALYDRWVRTVHGVLLSSVPRKDVDDLVQDVFLQAFRRLASLRDDAAFGGWLLAIARNRAADYHRRADPTEELTEDVAGSAPGERHEAQGAREALDAIRSLPAAYRETLALRLIEGMTGPEIAERTGLTPDSVRVNLYRGMKLLREALRPEGRHE
jgi:RNA polymerase sigma-70 factor (ECF subfamily)